MPLSESACYSSPDRLRSEVLGTTDMTPNESIHKAVLKASEELRSKLVLGE